MVVGLLLAIAVLSGGLVLTYPLIYRGRILPGVEVEAVDLSSLTVEEATSLLIEDRPFAPARSLTLRSDFQSWELSWAALGRTYDWPRTAETAYRVSRTGPWYHRALSAWRIRLYGRRVEPRIAPADTARVHDLLRQVALDVYTPPTDALLEIDSGEAVCTACQPGRALNVEATATDVLEALSQDVAEVQATMTVLSPDVWDPEPGCSRARALLSEPLAVIIDDPLTGYDSRFEIPPRQVGQSLRPAAASNGIDLEIDEATVRDWVLALAPQVSGDVILDVTETAERTLTSLADGDHRVNAAIHHPETTYVVEPGDTLFDIAYRNGYPVWRLEEANPDVEPGELLIGQELTIPSIDVLFPEPLIADKWIEIDLPEQRLRAYEDDEIVYDLTCSSGMTSTPTIAGQFQVLFKEPEAYAQRWGLTMPYFMAVYYEGPDFANGIHELPIRADGQRLWASVLGWPASYGCIILDVDDAKRLYDWAPVGTLVRIEGVAPGTPSVPQAYGPDE